MAENEVQYVAVPLAVWHATLETLRKELTMERAENLVAALRQCQVIPSPRRQPAAPMPPDETVEAPPFDE